MMEGISQEACSLAGHWGLGKLIALYDDNHISIDGNTDISFTEDVGARYKALGWQVSLVPVSCRSSTATLQLCSSVRPRTSRSCVNVQVIHVEDGNTDVDAIRKAIAEAKACTDKPTLIKVTTLIGYGAPNKADSYAAHGAPLGADETKLTRENLKWEYGEFEVPAEVTEVHSLAAVSICSARLYYPNVCTEQTTRFCTLADHRLCKRVVVTRIRVLSTCRL